MFLLSSSAAGITVAFVGSYLLKTSAPNLLRGHCILACKGENHGDFSKQHWDTRTTDDILLDIETAPRQGRSLLQIAKEAVLEAVRVTPSQTKSFWHLPQTLPDGSHNPAWLAARRWRLTASQFFRALNTRHQKQVAEQLVEKWWYRGQKPPKAPQFESNALLRFSKTCFTACDGPDVVKKVGVFVNADHPWLAASPDGMVVRVGNDGKNETLELIEVKSYHVYMDRKAAAWAQMQGSMAIASRALGVPVRRSWLLSTGAPRMICFDSEWWDSCYHKLENFYFDVYLPCAAQHLVDNWMKVYGAKTP